MVNNDYLELIQLVPEFMKIWTHGKGVKWSRQFVDRISGDLDYFPVKDRQPEEKDFMEHFMMFLDPTKPKPLTESRKIRGPLAFCGSFDGDVALWFCCDCDNALAVEAMETMLIPHLEREGIDYIFEYSGNGDKCHVWIRLELVPIKILQVFINQLFMDAGLDTNDKKMDFELYPSHKPNNVIRMPGLHLRTGKVSPLRTSDGAEGNTPLFMIKAFLGCKPLSLQEIQNRIRPEKKPIVLRKKIVQRGPFYYSTVGLPVISNLPPAINKIAKNCQAIHRLLKEAEEDKLIEMRGGVHHTAGLYLYNLAFFNDIVMGRQKPTTEGQDWAEKFFKDHRLRSHKEHNWVHAPKIGDRDTAKYVPRCDTLERDFGYCEGCPFKNKPGFTSPRQLFYGKPVLKKMVKDVKLVSHQQVRTSTFVTVKERVKALVRAGASRRVLAASPLGSGKSQMLDELAVELAREGRKVLIAVHAGDIALEHKKRIEKLGGHAYLLMSHKNHFEKYNPGFDCPDFADIQDYVDLGVSSNAIRKSFCDSCPFETECRYPKQYAEALNDDHNIIIMQHAHFASGSVMQTILQKRFDLLMIDEAFTDNLLMQLKATELEWTLLSNFDFPWIEHLRSWMEHGGNPSTSSIFPTPDQLFELREHFEKYMAPWRIPDFIRAYNNEYFMDKSIGLHVYCPPPIHRINVTLMTDATPPPEILQIYLDDKDIEIYGDDEVFDYRILNEGNKAVQVLNSTMSKTALKGMMEEGEYSFDRLIEILEFIGDKARGEFSDKKILITTYKEFKPLCEEWLTANYPDIIDRVLISHMKVGTNEFEHYEVQFLIAGVYLNGRQFHKQVYELKIVANYWNRLNGRALLPNFHWFGVEDTAGIERCQEPVRRIVPLGNKAGLFEYDDFMYYRPTDYYYNLVERYAISKTQQAIRLRFNDNKQKIIYVLGKFFLSSFLITDNPLEGEVFGYLRAAE